ncbi:MAG: zinc-dependent metalloprotease [Spirosomaceae bacterium]|jgi:hypothetical protein|nr:zinc-dependent metalloprotease [Spirosomataceae bacterium]
MKQKLLLMIITAVIITISSCEIDKSIDAKDAKLKIPDNTQVLLQYLKSMGFKEEDIDDRGDRFVVEGDMVFKKSDYNHLQGAKEEQAYNPNELIFNEKKQTIRVMVHASVKAYHQEIDKAIDMWNNVNLYRLADDPIPESNIRFVKVTTGAYDLLIEGGRAGFKAGELANSRMPVNGNPGSEISLNLNPKEFSDEMHGHQVAIIAHELGHAIGLQHTNWREVREVGIRDIPDTPKTERGSLMNQETGATLQGLSLTTNDRKAVRVLYPKKPYGIRWEVGLVATLKWTGPVHRVKSYTVNYTIKSGDFFLTTKKYSKEVAITGRDGSLAIPFSCRCRSITYTAQVRINYVDGTSSEYVSSPSLTL